MAEYYLYPMCTQNLIFSANLIPALLYKAQLFSYNNSNQCVMVSSLILRLYNINHDNSALNSIDFFNPSCYCTEGIFFFIFGVTNRNCCTHTHTSQSTGVFIPSGIPSEPGLIYVRGWIRLQIINLKMDGDDEPVEPQGFGYATVKAGRLICRSMPGSPWSIKEGTSHCALGEHLFMSW